MPFSVITSVYQKDNPEFTRVALESIIVDQSCIPSEVVLVIDGPICSELEKVISSFEASFGNIFKVIRLSKNHGLGYALHIGMENASNEIIARMDSDDISFYDRFSKQIDFLESHPEVAIIGGEITEFIDNPSNIVGKRIVPLTHAEIVSFMRTRCPMNHMSVMFRKSEVQRVGGYLDWPWNEDYYLWIRMAAGGCKFANLPDVLVNVRVGKEMYARRGGWQYFKSERGIQRLMLQKKMISVPRYLVNVTIRFCMQVLMPSSIRGWVFRTFARE